MLWQYLLLTTTLIFVESKVQRRLFKKVGKPMSKFSNPQHLASHSQPNLLRIRNEYPIQLQGGEENIQIWGGNVTNTQNFPYMAAIFISGRLWCAGAIVDASWVLTAAHCLNYVLHVSPSKTLYKYVKVRVGSSNAHEGGDLVDVIGAIRHPKYEKEPVPHADVALMKLAENLEFHKFVNMIPMYEGTSEPYAQSFIEVSGWGSTRGTDLSFREHAVDMLTARLKIRPQQYCVDSYQLVDGFQFTSDFFCASLRNGTRDACLFDAGAPAVQNNELMGIMSFGPEKCGHTFQPAVFIKTFYFRDFVENIISQHQNDKNHLNYRQHKNNTMKVAESDADLPIDEPDYGNANILLVSNNEESKEDIRLKRRNNIYS